MSFASKVWVGFLLVLIALSSLVACGEGDGMVRVHGGSPPTASLTAGTPAGLSIAPEYVQAEGYWEVDLPDGGSISHGESQYISPSQGSFFRAVRIDDVQPGDDIQIGRGTEPLPTGCRCVRAASEEAPPQGVDVYVSQRSGDRSTSRRFSPRVVSAFAPTSFIICDDLDYDDLREDISTLSC